MLVYFILRDAIVHLYKQTVVKLLAKKCFEIKKVMCLDFNLADQNLCIGSGVMFKG